jgi:hypothetical protein
MLLLTIFGVVVFAASSWENSETSWTDKCRNASKRETEQIELLLECDIISKDEFASSHVGQDRIIECMRIASTMLKQKTFEEWVALSRSSKQEFHDCVAKIAFSDGTDAKPLGSNVHSIWSTPSSSSSLTPSTARTCEPRSDDTSTVALKKPSEAARSPAIAVTLPGNFRQVSYGKSPVPLLDCAHEKLEVVIAGDSPIAATNDSKDELFPSLMSSGSLESSKDNPKLSTAAPSTTASVVDNWSTSPSPNPPSRKPSVLSVVPPIQSFPHNS